MKNEYEQSPISERILWREKLRNRLIHMRVKPLEDSVIERSAKFVRSEYTATMTPKSILNAYCIQAKLDKPVYHTDELKPQRVFRTVLEFNGQRYTTTTWEKSKQLAEQGSAIVCLQCIGIDITRAKYGGTNIKSCFFMENKS